MAENKKNTVISHEEGIQSLGISKKSYIEFRKELGIFEETRKGLMMSHFLLLQERVKKVKRQKLTDKKIKTPVDMNSKKFNKYGELKIDELDSQVVVHLKNDYNKNRRYIEFFQSIIDVDVASGDVPERDIINAITNYEKLNLHILKDIERESKRTDAIEDMIANKLSSYGS